MLATAGVEMRAYTSTLRKRTSEGFSTIELMVVLSVAAILLGIGVPSFQTLQQSQQITAATNDLFAAINLTRSEAIQRGTRVDLVPAEDGTDWAKGWSVFVDENNNQRPDHGEQVIFSHGAVAHGIRIKANFSDSKVQYVAYNGTGRTRTNASSHTPQLGTLALTLDRHERRIKINFLGRARVCNPATDGPSC